MRTRTMAVLLGMALALAMVPGRAAAATEVSGPISYNTTWSIGGSPYVVTEDVTVQQGVTLTIAPGVVVKFVDGYKDLIVNGVLSAVGTATSPIYFTSYLDDTVGGDTNGDGGATSPGADNWGGILFSDSSDDSQCVLEYAVVRYGGYYWSSTGARNILLSSASPRFSYCTFGDAGGPNIYISDGSFPQIENCTFSNPGDWPIDAPATGLSQVGPNTYSSNGHDAIYVRSGNISSDVSWTETGAPLYLQEDVTVDEGSVLTIQAGVMVKPSGGSVDLIVNGGLEARGTSSQRIYFTSYLDDNDSCKMT